MFGYLLELPAETDVSFHNDLQLIYELPEERMKHYKSSRMHQLDQQIGDIKMEISDIETTTMLRFKIMTYSKSNNKNSSKSNSNDNMSSNSNSNNTNNNQHLRIMGIILIIQ